MKYALLLSFVIFSSLCTIPNIPGLPTSLPVSQASLGFQVTSDPDLLLAMNATPSQVQSGRTLVLDFEIKNNENVDLKDFNIFAYDQCLFSGESTWTPTDGTLRRNEVRFFTFKWTAQSVDFIRECNLKFRTQYTANTTVEQDVIAFKESEIIRYEQLGLLSSITPNVYARTSPLAIKINFSKPQPLTDQDTVFMYIDYENVGDGLVDIQSITITLPTNLIFNSCNDYVKTSNDTITLNKKINFIKNTGSQSTCSFTVNATKAQDTQFLSLIAMYKYMLDNSIIVKILR